jgi:hypothetical protein
MHFSNRDSSDFSWSVRRRFIPLLITSVLLIATLTCPMEPVAAKGATVTPGPTLAVDGLADRHSISRDIYGMNYADPALAQELKLPVNRMGGNATSRYNWQVDSSNSGSDWYFVGGKNSDTAVPGESVDNFVNTNQSTGTKSIATMPMVPYINKTSAKNCSYPSTLYPDQQAWEPYPGPDGSVCGNGKDLNGNPIADTNLLLNNIPNSPEYQQQWMQHLLSAHKSAKQGGVQLYDLDNEPSLWQYTHQDIHPGPTGFDELVNLSKSYGAMIKSSDSGAKILGPSDWGYTAYTTGIGAPGDDSSSHGNIGFGEYYLQQMQAYEKQHGVRLLDYFDEHYYPQESGVALGATGDANTQALRLRSTRSLWDPTYVDESWIGTYAPPIQLIPWFRSWINKNYPGTKLAMSEYNWGGLDSINGALTEADVLGIFGREGLDLATLWGPPTATQPGSYAFRMYLNYDGQGSSYGDTSIRSTSSDQGQLAVYGAQRSSDGALTLMVINKTATDLTSPLTLSGAVPAGKAQVYSYSDANLGAIVRQPDIALNQSGFTKTYPANSMTLVVIPPTTFHVNYQIVSKGPNTFTATLALTNAGNTRVNNWTLQFSFPGNQVITQLWNGDFVQSGQKVTVTNNSYNAIIPPHGLILITLKGAFHGKNSAPTMFTVDGVPISVT